MKHTTIKQKQLHFKYNSTEFRVKITYDTSPFGVGGHSFWETELFEVDGTKLLSPLTYSFRPSRGCLLQSPKYREHRYIYSSKKEIENTTNLYPLVKERVIYQWFNRNNILKYEAQINNFNLLIEEKYNKKLAPFKEQKRALKQKLKAAKIDSKQYQKLYTPIRKKLEEIEYHVWDICYSYKKRYFYCDKLKPIYQKNTTTFMK